jgi:RNA polymerase sigma-70 factor, ECF subfamily
MIVVSHRRDTTVPDRSGPGRGRHTGPGPGRPRLHNVDADTELLNSLRHGNEEAFVMLVARYQSPLLRLAQSIISNHTVAQEAVQDTWIGVVRGVERFEGRSSFKTWLFAILVNRARSAVSREHPDAPMETLHTVDPLRFDPEGNWSDPLESWTDSSDERLDAAAWLPAIKSALERSASSSTTGRSIARRRRALPRRGLWRARDKCREPTDPVTPGPGPPPRDPRSRDGEEVTDDLAPKTGSRMSASSRAGHRLP